MSRTEPPEIPSRLRLDDIKPESIPPESEKAAAHSNKEESDYLDNELKRHELDSRKQDTKERKDYATKLFRLISAWLLSILTILMLSGFGRIGCLEFKLSDAVLLGLIGGTTATVLGLFVIVVNYLFPNRK